jgi:protein-disulfide isomerase
MSRISDSIKNPWVIICLITTVLIGGSVWYSIHVGATYNDGVVVTNYVKGNPDAAVVLAEYADFQCPACGQFEPIVAAILSEFGEQIRFEFNHFPLAQLHPFAEAAARAAEAAGQQGKFFEYHDLLFANQAAWSKSATPAVFFSQYAKELDLDLALFTKHQRASLLQDHIRSQFSEAQNKGLTGTPTFFLNGQQMKYTSADDFKAQIVAAINPSVDFNLDGAEVPLSVRAVEKSEEGAATDPVTAGVRFGI